MRFGYSCGARGCGSKKTLFALEQARADAQSYGAMETVAAAERLARRFGLAIHVRSSFSYRDGTWVSDLDGDDSEGDQMEQAIIAGVAHDRSEAKITVVGVPDKPGEAAAIFRTVADAEINIDMIVQNVSAASTGRTASGSTTQLATGAAT